MAKDQQRWHKDLLYSILFKPDGWDYVNSNYNVPFNRVN